MTTKTALLFSAALLLASPARSEDFEVSADESRIFDLLMSRRLAAEGIPAKAAHTTEGLDPSLPGNDPELIKKNFAEEEKLRAAAFDREFGAGAYAKLTAFTGGCVSTKDCSKLDAGGLIEAAYLLAALQEDADKGLSLKSQEHRKRLQKIKAGMKPHLQALRPKMKLNAADAGERLSALEPLAVKILSKKEAAAFLQALKP